MKFEVILKKEILLIGLIFLFFSCTNKNFIILPDYKKNSIKESTLLVMVVDKPKIENSDDVTDDLGPGDPVDVYLKYFADKFPKYINQNTYITDIMIDTSFIKKNLKEELFKLKENDKVEIYVPTNKLSLKSNSSEPDFVLLIQDINIDRKYANSGATPPDSPIQPAGAYLELVHNCKTLIWDNTQNKVVSYGKFKCSSAISFKMGKDNWDEILRNMVQLIFKNSSFKVKRRTNR